MQNPEETAFGAMYDHTVTGRGVLMPLAPVPRKYHSSSFKAAEGHERSVENAW